MTPEQRAEAVFNRLAGNILALEETGWMNKEDKEELYLPFAAAIREAVIAERERCLEICRRVMSYPSDDEAQHVEHLIIKEGGE